MRALARDAMLESAAHYAESFEHNQLTAAPTRSVVVVTCMDARLDLFRLLGLRVGDSHILRNAGGRVTEDTMRSLLLSSHLLGTREFVVIHHTGCGLFKITNDVIVDRVRATSGHRVDIDFRPFDDVEQSVRDDVDLVRRMPGLPSDAVVWGGVYDVDDGILRPIGGPIGVAGDRP